ncbi:MAG: iron-sulfur cluster assembly scaffold protein [Candidatus Pacearchaeota archaeon]|jgi:nitrogen fixation NifU-like protein
MAHENVDDMYREEILELYKSPSNFGELKNPSHKHTSHNSICGDEITVEMNVKAGKIDDIKFSGSGCVVSMVSSSLLTDKIKGMPISQVKNMKGEEALDLLKTKLTPSRMKCALLSFEAVKGALK